MTTLYPPAVDLAKVAYWSFYYSNGKGSTRKHKPTEPSVNGTSIEPNELAAILPDYPFETCLERAMRRKLLDTWTPTLDITLSNGHFLTFTKTKATTLNSLLWNRAKIHNPKT